MTFVIKTLSNKLINALKLKLGLKNNLNLNI